MNFFVDSKTYAERYAICKSCEEFTPLTKQCTLCKCFMPIKAKLSMVECPLKPTGKWAKSKSGNTQEIQTIEE